MNKLETPVKNERLIHHSINTGAESECPDGISPTILTAGQLASTFVTGAVAYPVLEIAFRGYSHWTMSLAGGLCFTALFGFQAAFFELPFWRKALLGMLTIVFVELSIGTVVNLWLGWAVWDYTNLRFHYLGQISLLFALIWYGLCSVFFWIAGRIRIIIQ